jgi:hypothetical protein
MVKSLLQRNKACYICGTTLNLHLHHIFYGTANRSISDADGCVVYLCQAHHTGARGVHFNKKLDLSLKMKCEQAYLKQNSKTIDDFIQRYGKNYL